VESLRQDKVKAGKMQKRTPTRRGEGIPKSKGKRKLKKGSKRQTKERLKGRDDGRSENGPGPVLLQERRKKTSITTGNKRSRNYRREEGLSGL